MDRDTGRFVKRSLVTDHACTYQSVVVVCFILNDLLCVL